MRTIKQLVDRCAEDYPDKVFLIAPDTGQEITYKQLQIKLQTIGKQLIKRGLTKGDKVSFMLHNGSHTVMVFLGAMYSGLVICPINLQAQNIHLQYIVEHSDSRIIFTIGEYKERLEKIIWQIPRKIELIEIDLNDKNIFPYEDLNEIYLPEISEDDPAQILYTSGTTGLPKGAVLTHKNMVSGGENVTLAHKLGVGDRALCSLPLYHINGQIVTTVSPLVHRGSVVMPYRFQTSTFWQLISRYKCTWFSVVPTIISYLLNASKIDPYRKDLDLKRIRFGRSASAPLPPTLEKEFEEVFHIPMIQTLGLTETAAPIFSNLIDKKKYGSAGIPIGNEVKVVDELGNEKTCGQPGEIIVRGDNVMQEYYKAPDITGETLIGGWLHTGDVGYRDEDGYYFVVGRVKEFIKKGGEKIAPAEIDTILYKHPCVLEAAAVGVPDEQYGEEIEAFVVLKQDLQVTEEALISFCHNELGKFKTPKYIRFTDSLPKGPSGKIQRLELIKADRRLEPLGNNSKRSKEIQVMGKNQESVKTALCTQACPVGLDVPRYIRCIKQGNFLEAFNIIREKLPFPTVCSDACFAPCEEACAYKQIADPIAIRALKRAAVDYGSKMSKQKKLEIVKTGKKVVIVGSGPAGLTAAYYLAQKGHSVIVYDTFPKPGGMMRYGIPKYRLPEDRLDKDLEGIFELGVEFIPNTTLGKQITLDKLQRQNDAALLATGATESVKIEVEGLHKIKYMWAWELLRDVALGKQIFFKGDIVVIGGGNVAIDAALTAKRLGAKNISLVCLEGANEMPAHEWEIARAVEEGVKILNGWGLKRITGDGTANLELVKCKSVFDKAKKFNPVFDEKTRISLETQYLLLAVGQSVDLSYLKDETKFKAPKGTLKVNSDTLATEEPNIFAAGDVVSGPSSIIEAIAQGKKVAISMDKFLGGSGKLYEGTLSPVDKPAQFESIILAQPRTKLSILDVSNRNGSFKQIELGYTPDQARQEAERCLMCDIKNFEVVIYPENCKECGYCVEACGLDVFKTADYFNKRGYRPIISIAPEKCIGCLRCFFVCPDFAIDVKKVDLKGANI